MAHLDLERKKHVSSFRKIALGTWKDAYDPSVYGTLEVRMEAALKYIEEMRAKTGLRVTINHLMCVAIAKMFKAAPDSNAILRFNSIYLRKSVGVFFQVVMTDEGTGKVDLSGVTIHNAETKSLPVIVREFEESVERVRKRKDPALEQTRKTMLGVPSLLIHWVLRLVAFLTYTLNLDLSAFGLPKDPFGSIMVTNVGSMGLDVAYAPLVPYSHVPMILALGAVKDAPVVDGGQVRVGKVMRISATFDHRFIDGYHASVMSRTLRTCFEEPEKNFGPIVAVQAAG